jgi:hypothetical protein
VGQGAVRPLVVAVGGEGAEQGLELAGVAGWARSHFFIVCWNRPAFP